MVPSTTFVQTYLEPWNYKSFIKNTRVHFFFSFADPPVLCLVLPFAFCVCFWHAHLSFYNKNMTPSFGILNCVFFLGYCILSIFFSSLLFLFLSLFFSRQFSARLFVKWYASHFVFYCAIKRRDFFIRYAIMQTITKHLCVYLKLHQNSWR